MLNSPRAPSPAGIFGVSPYNYPLIFDPQDELTMMKESLCRIIAGELQARAEQVEAAVRLLDEGNTVPFIARYRKEVTGGLDDTQLRNPRPVWAICASWKTDVRRSSNLSASRAS